MGVNAVAVSCLWFEERWTGRTTAGTGRAQRVSVSYQAQSSLPC